MNQIFLSLSLSLSLCRMPLPNRHLVQIQVASEDVVDCEHLAIFVEPLVVALPAGAAETKGQVVRA